MLFIFILDVSGNIHYTISNKAEYELIQSSGGTGPMKLRQPLRKQNGANSVRFYL